MLNFFKKDKISVTEMREALREILTFIGEDPNREGLLETPDRIIKSWNELYEGYKQSPEQILSKCFSETDGYDQMVLLKNVGFFSCCLVGSTFIDTPKGRIPLNRLKDGETIYCFDEDKQKMTIAKAVNPRMTGRNKRLWRIYTDKDTVLCTEEHKFLTFTRGWIKAKDLVPGDSVVALNKGATSENGVTRAYLSWTGRAVAQPEHRFVYSEIFGKIGSKNHIHHINKKPNDNSPENLACLTGPEHSRLHRLSEESTGFALFTDEQRVSMRERQIQGIKKSQTADVKAKRSMSLKKYWGSLSSEQRQARNHKVLLVEKTDWQEDVWCMDVPGFENFVANGMVVHNCEHHNLPFIGVAHIGYLPTDSVVGISKLARLLDCHARRMQIQERMTRSVALDLMKYVKPQGVAVAIRWARKTAAISS